MLAFFDSLTETVPAFSYDHIENLSDAHVESYGVARDFTAQHGHLFPRCRDNYDITERLIDSEIVIPAECWPQETCSFFYFTSLERARKFIDDLNRLCAETPSKIGMVQFCRIINKDAYLSIRKALIALGAECIYTHGRDSDDFYWLYYNARADKDEYFKGVCDSAMISVGAE